MAEIFKNRPNVVNEEEYAANEVCKLRETPQRSTATPKPRRSQLFRFENWNIQTLLFRSSSTSSVSEVEVDGGEDDDDDDDALYASTKVPSVSKIAESPRPGNRHSFPLSTIRQTTPTSSGLPPVYRS